jgi:hypothetical protein
MPSPYADSKRNFIPLFVFLGLIMTFVPLTIWVLNCIRKRRETRQSKNESSQAETGQVQRPIELNILPQQPSATVPKTRSDSRRHAPEPAQNPNVFVEIPLSPRYDLQTTLEHESSPATVGEIDKRKATVHDSITIKSQHASTGHAVQAFAYQQPAVPRVSAHTEFTTAYPSVYKTGYYDYSQQPKTHDRWV